MITRIEKQTQLSEAEKALILVKKEEASKNKRLVRIDKSTFVLVGKSVTDAQAIDRYNRNMSAATIDNKEFIHKANNSMQGSNKRRGK